MACGIRSRSGTKLIRWRTHTQEVQSACAAPQHCLHYVRNQKAGSESMLHNLGRACAANEYCKAHALHSNSQSWGGPRTWPGLWRRPFAAPGLSWHGRAHRHFEREPAWPPAGDVSFTVVREPIATAVAAHLEISRRPDGLAETAKPAYRSMARNNCSAPNARFEAFLDDIERRRNLGNQAFHAWPQALKVWASTRPLDLVVKLEHINRGMEEVLAALRAVTGGPSIRIMAAPVVSKSRQSRLEVHTTRSVTTASDNCTLDLTDPSLLRRLCRLYFADFVCFGYELPQACLSLDTDYRGVAI